MAPVEKPFHSTMSPAETLVLYVEDDLINQQVLQHSLMDKPHIIIRTASNLEEAIDVLEDLECWPDLILMDNQLIGITGGEVMQEIWQTYPSTKAIPLVMCTALSTTEAAKVAQQCEAQAFLCKPYNIKDLVQTIKLHAIQGLPASRSTPEMQSEPSGTAELQPPPLPPHTSAPMHAIAKVKSPITEQRIPSRQPEKRQTMSRTSSSHTNDFSAKSPRAEALLARHSASTARSHQVMHQSSLYANGREGLMPPPGAWTDRFSHSSVTSSKLSHVQNEIGPIKPSGSMALSTIASSGDASSQLSGKQDSMKTAMGGSLARGSLSGSGHGLGNELPSASSRPTIGTYGNQAALAEIVRVLDRGPVGVRDSHLTVQLSVAEFCDILEMHYVGRMLAEKGLDIAKLCTMSAWDIMQAGVVVLSQLDKLMNGLAALS